MTLASKFFQTSSDGGITEELSGLITGVADGGLLTANVDTTKFDISDGSGYVVDPTTDPQNPTVTKVTWSGETALIPTFIATNNISYIGIDIAGTVIQQATAFTTLQRRSIIVLGTLVHSGAVITNTSDLSVLVSRGLAPDLALAIGDINIFGNNFNPAATNLTIRREAGESFRASRNRPVSALDPNFEDSPVDAAVTFLYVYDDGAGGATVISAQTNIDPDQYDNGSGTLAAVANNKWTNQLCYWYPGTDIAIVRYGNEEFMSLADAESGLGKIPPTIGSGIDPELVRTTISVVKGATDLSDISQAVFTATGKFGLGSGGGSGAGGTFQDLQETYNNSLDPEIITDSTRGAMTYQRGSAADTDDVLEILNGAGTQVFAVTGEGIMVGESIWWPIAFGDEDTDITVGTAKATLHAPPFATTLAEVIVGMTGAPTGSVATFDFNVNGVSALSTLITVDAGAFTSATATIPPAIGTPAVAANAKLTWDIDGIGATEPGKGPKGYARLVRV